jgi:hypothetical protein
MNRTIQEQAASLRHVEREYQKLTDHVLATMPLKEGDFSILVKPEHVSIRCKEYSTFLLAKKAIKGRTSREIVWDHEGLN